MAIRRDMADSGSGLTFLGPRGGKLRPDVAIYNASGGQLLAKMELKSTKCVCGHLIHVEMRSLRLSLAIARSLLVSHCFSRAMPVLRQRRRTMRRRPRQLQNCCMGTRSTCSASQRQQTISSSASFRSGAHCKMRLTALM
jgi:hypothetical protein